MKPLILSLVFSLVALSAVRADEPPGKAAQPTVKVATFDVDATPPLGSGLRPGQAARELTLRCRAS
jgi:hypothetical protein